MKLAFDLHGVIMYLMPILQKYYKEVVGFEITARDRFSFDYPDSYDPRRFGVDIANAIRTMSVEHAKPVRGSIAALTHWWGGANRLRNDIIIVTASAKSTMDANNEWLDKWLKIPYEIHSVTYQEGKIAKLKELGVTHFVDDRFKTCNDLADHLEHVYLFDAPCNRGRTTKANVTRVRSLQKAINHYEKSKCL